MNKQLCLHTTMQPPPAALQHPRSFAKKTPGQLISKNCLGCLQIPVGVKVQFFQFKIVSTSMLLVGSLESSLLIWGPRLDFF